MYTQLDGRERKRRERNIHTFFVKLLSSALSSSGLGRSSPADDRERWWEVVAIIGLLIS
jgi:hypothetical protein